MGSISIAVIIPAAADDLGEDGAVIAGSRADMYDVGAMAQLELVIHTRPKTGLPVVEPPFLVDRDQHIMVEVARIGVLGRPIFAHCHRAEDAPRPRPAETFPRHRREGIDNGTRPQPRGKA